MNELNEFLTKWEGLWLFVILAAELVASLYTAWTVKREYEYDERKDLEKKQRRTKTTKKTTKGASGEVTEETTETVEPIGEIKNGN